MNTIGGRIYRLRREKGSSQDELANSLNVSRQTVSRWESNLAMPTAANIKAICNFFSISEDCFFKGLKKERIHINDADVIKVLRCQYAARGNCYTLAFAIFFTVALLVSLVFSVHVGLSVFPLSDAYITISTNGYTVDLFIVCIVALAVAIGMSTWLWLRFVTVRRRIKPQKDASIREYVTL